MKSQKQNFSLIFGVSIAAVFCFLTITFGFSQAFAVESGYDLHNESNGYCYIVKQHSDGVKNVYDLKKTNGGFRSGNTVNFYEDLGMTEEEYRNLPQSYKDDLNQAVSIHIEESNFQEDGKNKISPLSQKDPSYPENTSDNGYMKVRYTVLNTGNFNASGNEIFTFKVDYQWLKMPAVRRKDVFALSWTDHFLVHSAPAAYMQWSYQLTPNHIQPGVDSTGTIDATEVSDNTWGNMVDGVFYISTVSNRHSVTVDLPDSSNVFTPSGYLKMGYSVDVVYDGSNELFCLWSNYAHDQGIIGQSKPDVGFGIKSISIGSSGFLKEWKYYDFMTSDLDINNFRS